MKRGDSTGSGKLRRLAEFSAEALEAGGPRVAAALTARLAMGRLRFGFGMDEFLLFDLPNRSSSDWADYIREESHNATMLRILHPPPARIARDKVLSLERMAAKGLAITPVLAIVGRDPLYRCEARFPLLADRDAIVAASRDWPDQLFVKPVSDSYGRGVMAFTRNEGGWHDGSALWSPQKLAEILLFSAEPTGVLVQPRIVNDPALRPINADFGLAATRIITALTEDGPEIVAVIQKILGRPALSDHFSSGFSGHLVGTVDLKSGCLGAVYGRSAGHRHLLTQFDSHPGTGAVFAGFELPHWPELIELAKQAALAFPELPLPGHDLAITEDGPLFLETNTYWVAALPQLAIGGLRPRLKELIPRLAVSKDVKAQALRAITP